MYTRHLDTAIRRLHAVAALGREPGTVQLRRAGLAEAEVADQLEATFGRRFDLRVVAGVAGRTGGNPFFVAELGRLVSDAAAAGRARVRREWAPG